MLKFFNKTKILSSLNGRIISTTTSISTNINTTLKRNFSIFPIRTSIFNNEITIPKRMMIKIEGAEPVKKELTKEEKQKIKERKKLEQIERNALKKENRVAMIERSKQLKKTKEEKDNQSSEKKSHTKSGNNNDEEDDDEFIDYAEGDGEFFSPKKEKVKVKPNKKKPNNDKGFHR
ncbi:hypothetical protein ACTA71_006996 [Dictyostelium dimigraforme]